MYLSPQCLQLSLVNVECGRSQRYLKSEIENASKKRFTEKLWKIREVDYINLVIETAGPSGTKWKRKKMVLLYWKLWKSCFSERSWSEIESCLDLDCSWLLASHLVVVYRNSGSIAASIHASHTSHNKAFFFHLLHSYIVAALLSSQRENLNLNFFSVCTIKIHEQKMICVVAFCSLLSRLSWLIANCFDANYGGQYSMRC